VPSDLLNFHSFTVSTIKHLPAELCLGEVDTLTRAVQNCCSCKTAAMETVVDAFVWPLRLLGLAAPKEGELDHIPLLALPPNCIVNHLVPALDAKEKANLSLTCTAMSQLMAGSVKQLKFDGREMCFAARSPRLLQVGWT
jgi:hypothetical protein